MPRQARQGPGRTVFAIGAGSVLLLCACGSPATNLLDAGPALDGPPPATDAAPAPADGPPACLTEDEYAALRPVFRWRSATDRLWTTDLQGEQAARLGYYSEGRVFYVSAEGSDKFPRAIYRLRGTLGHLYTTSSAERDARRAAGDVDEGVLGYVATAPLPGCDLEELRAWRDAQGRRFLTVNPAETAALASLGYVDEGVAGYTPRSGPRPASSPYKVGVYYFGMWSAAAFETIEGWPFANRNFHGPDRAGDWWLGVRDMYEHNCTHAGTLAPSLEATFQSYCAADWSHLKPRLGFYDLADPTTIEKHIQQASENGIAFFAFYWFWNYYLGREDVNDGLDNFLLARNSQDLEFTITVCQHGGHLSMDAARAQTAAALIVDKYVTRPNFLRTRDGRPIINLCDTRGIWAIPDGASAGSPPAQADYETIEVFLNSLRAETHAATGQWPLLTARADDDRYNPPSTDPNAPGLIAHVEAGNCILPTGPNPSYQGIVDGVVGWLDSVRGWRPLMPCFVHNLDDRPRIGVMKSAGFIDFPDDSAANFAIGLQHVKTWIDAQDDELSHILFLYAWNEWHEGGIIEPNVRDGALLLNLISDAFQLPRGSHPCLGTGDCPGP